MSNWNSPSGRKSVKWRGTSLTKLKEHEGQLGEAIVTLRLANRVIRETREKIKEDVSEVLKRGGINIEAREIALGVHDCEESPTLRCIYNEARDRYLDDCIFCHDPNERK